MPGGAYALAGSVGQSDAGRTGGGTYTVAGGFWPGALVVPIEGGPTLQVQLVGTTISLSWGPDAADFVLQQTDALGSPWDPAPSGPENPVTVPVGVTAKIFRLAKP